MYLGNNIDGFRNDITKGLRNPQQKSTPSKYLYDTLGSQLFELITEQPEYYPTRTEINILKNNSSELIKNISKDIVLIELGSGSSKKTQYLFHEILRKQEKLYYFPIDISMNFLDSIVTSLETLNKNLVVRGIPDDYINGIKQCNNILFENNIYFDTFSRLIVFFGSSIGNFEPEEARDFLKQIRLNIHDKDFLLVGFDLIKDVDLIEPAYNDKAGFTSKFNLNLLNRINNELRGNFDMRKFHHHAFYNSSKNRVEMHIKSRVDQTISILTIDENFHFDAGETIHTENSYKYDLTKIENLASRSGFAVDKVFSDKNDWFNLVLFRPC
ncbi:Histidine-specific methyltransferase EgtD [Candidatus Nitrosocosmicus franklandus]|uniref:Histidine-specific methyltransferase EgtD n=1 Tax=Candidatus Nitrosocosmicus franklandianus TaxID=1798806 RepID=A0A484I5Q1_9ARCH|nr:Histidine-specific methyltransferase EgtD [Candidatus Nitrosocosmicus franklandus]